VGYYAADPTERFFNVAMSSGDQVYMAVRDRLASVFPNVHAYVET